MLISFENQVLSSKEILLDKSSLKEIPSKNHKKAIDNAKHIFAVDFEYEANGKKYNGFYAHLKEMPEKKSPVVILNRGGTGLYGFIDARQIFSGFATSVIKAGYIVIGSQCMGTAEDGAKDEMGGEDFQSVLALKKFIEKDNLADTEKIGLYCASRGAVATFRLLTETNWAKAAVVISGALDFFDDEFRPEMKEHYEKTFGGSTEEREKRSVMYWSEKLPKNVPLLLMYGTSDWRVNPQTALQFSEKLINLEIPFRLVMFEGDDHMLTKNWLESRALGVNWLDRFVRNNEEIPDMKKHGK
ncbi:MAG: prolyl oligopeptidase family serine peptidase [Candidatus Moraniibacteriota bacterium]